MPKYPFSAFLKNYVRVVEDIRGALFLLYACQRMKKKYHEPVPSNRTKKKHKILKKNRIFTLQSMPK